MGCLVAAMVMIFKRVATFILWRVSGTNRNECVHEARC
jgi:hypothetical protein